MAFCSWRSARTTWMAGAVLIAASCPFAAQANDSAAHLGAGGLEFTTTDAVVMEKEDLFLSPDLVKVDYVFRNVTDRPVDLRVAFPLPRLDMQVVQGCEDVGIPFPEEGNFVGFATQVNGRPVKMEVQTKAFLGNREITGLLREMNIPFADLGDALRTKLGSLRADERKRLVAEGAIKAEGVCNDWPQPLWTAETIYHWQESFQPGAPTRISHRYQPVTGIFFVEPHEKLQGPPERMTPHNQDLTRFCVDEGTWRAIRKKGNGAVQGRNLEYILQTARSWKGPIREFTLTIDKGSPDTIISLCESGIRKTGSTTFEVRKRDFRPDGNLDVLFVR